MCIYNNKVWRYLSVVELLEKEFSLTYEWCIGLLRRGTIKELSLFLHRCRSDMFTYRRNKNYRGLVFVEFTYGHSFTYLFNTILVCYFMMSRYVILPDDMCLL